MSNYKHYEGEGAAKITQSDDFDFPYARVIKVQSLTICTAEGNSPKVAQANAERIVTAWNCHDELYNTLKEVLTGWHSNSQNFSRKEPEYINKVRIALTKVNNQ